MYLANICYIFLSGRIFIIVSKYKKTKGERDMDGQFNVK